WIAGRDQDEARRRQRLSDARCRLSLVEPGPVDLVDGRTEVFANKVLLEVQVARVRLESRLDRGVTHREDPAPHPKALGQLGGDSVQRNARGQPPRPVEVSGQIAIPQLEPRSLAQPGQCRLCGEGVPPYAPAA